MEVPGVMVFKLEGSSPGLYRPYPPATLSGEVFPTMDSDAISVECGVEAECVGHLYRRNAFQ